MIGRSDGAAGDGMIGRLDLAAPTSRLMVWAFRNWRAGPRGRAAIRAHAIARLGPLGGRATFFEFEAHFAALERYARTSLHGLAPGHLALSADEEAMGRLAECAALGCEAAAYVYAAALVTERGVRDTVRTACALGPRMLRIGDAPTGTQATADRPSPLFH